MTDSVESTSVYSIRNEPEDFVVIEKPMYLPTGEGGHTFLYVEKRGRTTEQVANELARASGVSARDVGYAGRKDRHALTSQWFSLPDLDPENALAFELTSATVLEARRHGHKLKTGHLRGNRFEIVLRGQGDSFELVTERAAEILRRGLPNRYGEQRFGMKGDNANEARKLLAGGKPPRDRRAARFLVSALQSEIFNAVLDERAETFDRVELGDLARVEESGGLFWVDDLERELPRAEAFEISATGPIFGTKVRAPKGYVAEIECRVFERFGLPTDPADPDKPLKLKLPRGIRARGTRRPLRVLPSDLKITALDGGEGLRLECGLPPGAYVTVLLDALVGPVLDASRRARESSPMAAGAGNSDPLTS